MSERVTNYGHCSARRAGRTGAAVVLAAAAHRGIGMLEFLIALLIFSTGMMGLLSAQLAGRSAGYEASQRSAATALARDILERMRANPRQIEKYAVSNIGDERRRLPEPGADCSALQCSAEQLAAFDLWQWEALLMGESEQYAGGNAGGLLAPRACITRDGGLVSVAITWLGTTKGGAVPVTACGNEASPDSDPQESSTQRRHQLAITTFIGVRD
jgi:type IV pilus assembly protein PilV